MNKGTLAEQSGRGVGFSEAGHCHAMLSHFSCVRLYDSMDCSLPGSSVHGILQARILEWAAISFSRGRPLCMIIMTSLAINK